MDILTREVSVKKFFQTIVENIDSNHHELESINLNEIDFDPVLRYGYRKRMEEVPLHTSLSGINSVGRSFHFCLSNLVE